ncbi:MAG: hypothetical protein Q7W45_03500 [Bacteroidota bacterium]|nr:hypothetical protein [Bacteroidota bacterium]MDP3143869.1 hypothetical protein [Bacteroidota bacterium]MDP3558017.1 hypothetical protein [Bacteroidota bacterium]
MKKNKLIYSLSLVMLTSVLVFTSCKKKKAFKEEDGQASEDNRSVQTENDAAVSDVNTVAGNNNFLHGRGTSVSGIEAINSTLGITAVPYTIDTTGAYLGTIKINYDGVTVVNNRLKSGSIRLTIVDYALGKRWKQAGCVLKVDYLAFKVTRSSDSKSVELNGTQFITNDTGGSWWELLIVKTQASLGSSVNGSNLNVTFDGDKTAVYNINRRFTYTLPGGILTCTGEGIGSNGDLSSLENFGTTREGNTFTSQVTTPIVWNWTCGWWAPVQGEVNIKVEDKDFALKVLFSVDASGNPVSAAANSCPYGWKVEWKHKNKTKKKVIGYK